MKYLLTLFAIAFTFNSYSQITVVDTPHCFNHTLFATVTGGIIPTSSGITLDDGWSGVIPIGFTFNFYGVPYTQCVIGSNGCLGFNTSSAGSYNTWPISAPLATTTATDIRNVICGPWCDVLISAGGTIDYSMQGVAPFRNFAVTWCGTHMFSCTAEWLTTQIIIYETTNIVEVHIQHRTICSTGWNGSAAICGVRNAAGTVSTVAPGPPVHDYPTLWTVSTPEGWRFTPIAGPSYSVAPTPYAPIPYAASGIYWYDSTTGAYLGAGSTVTVNPLVPNTYIAAALGCNDTTKAYIHVLPAAIAYGGIPHISSVTAINPSVCGKCDGSIILHGLVPHNVDSIFYSFNGVPQATLIDSANALDSTITLRSLCAGTYDYIYVKVGNCPSNTVGPFVLAAPPIHLDLGYSVDLGCNGDQVTFYNLSTPSSYEYTTTWHFGDGSSPVSTPNATHVYTTQGTYLDTLHYATLYGCALDTTFTIPLNHPLFDSFATDYREICLGVPTNFTNYASSSTNGANTSSMLKYSWSFGDGATDSVPNPTHTYGNANMYYPQLTVTDTIGCQKTYTDTVEVISINVRTRVHDTSVCLVDSMPMVSYVTVIPDTVPFTYAWTATNNIGATDQGTANFFGVGFYTYTVTVATRPLTSNPSGCIASDTQKVNSYAPVVLTNLTTTPSTIPYGSSIQLNANGAVYYTWTPNNGSLSNNNVNNPVATPTDSMTVYTVYGMNLYGCVDSANITVLLDNTMYDGLPQAFTPNGDNLNDVFKITHITFEKLVDFRVFNRWGQEVFRTNNPEVGWDGKFLGTPQDMGVYNWIVTLGYVDGTTKTYKGAVTLIR